MSIVSVTENWTDWQGAVNINWELLRYEGEFERSFDVQFSDNDSSYKPLAALTASGIPAQWSALPGFPWTYVTGYAVRMLSDKGPLIVRVAVKYKIYEDPLAIPPVIRYSFATDTEELHQAIRPRTDPSEQVVAMTLTNSSGEAPETAVVKEYRDQLMTIEVNRADFNRAQSALYIDAVNSDTFYGFPAMIVKCRNITAEPLRAADLTYWHCVYEFQIRHKMSGPLGIGWRRRFLDEGFRKLVNVNNYIEKRAIVVAVYDLDSEGKDTGEPTYTPAPRPVMLDGHGGVLAKDAHPVYIEFEDYELLPFAALGLE